MKRKKSISILLGLFILAWFFQYFLCYISNLYFITSLIALATWFFLLGVVVYNLIKIILKSNKDYFSFLFLGIITITLYITYEHPYGIINWEKFEGESFLEANYLGTVNCLTKIQLKAKNRFKYSSYCFNKVFYFGTYQIKNDTIIFKWEEETGFLDTNGYAILHKDYADTTKYAYISLFKNPQAKRSMPMRIKKIDLKSLRIK